MGILTTLDGWCAKYVGCDLLLLAALLWAGVTLWRWLLQDAWSKYGKTPKVIVPAHEDECCRDFKGSRKFDYASEWSSWPRTTVPCWDPATLDYLGEVRAHSASDVQEIVDRAHIAQKRWAASSFAQRRQFLRVLQRFVIENSETIVTVACRDSGKTVVDAMLGEMLTTLEKLRWTVAHGERYLLPEFRDSGPMNLHKTSRVEWVPVGVVGAIVPWNYPFHNVFNPLISSVFSGNALVVKVSEFASWSTRYYGRVIQQCLEAVGAPRDLVQITTGYAETGSALVAAVDKVIFVGSVDVGHKVMETAAKTLTPVILELGGKDPFVVCDDTQPEELAQLVVRGAFQAMGQNCAGPERFIVYDKVYARFCKSVTALVRTMKQGPTLESEFIDCGACVHPPSLQNYQRLIDDAVAKGACVLVGGSRNSECSGQFFQPTVLADVTEDMLIAKEEVFGPILCIFKVHGDDDNEAVRLANNCCFGLSSCAHSADAQRAAKLCSRFEAGMSSVNDIEGTTYLSQSLPFGGLKQSGFGRFAGPEGLRGLCHEKSIVQNRASFLKPSIPRPIAYPSNGKGEAFCTALFQIMYGQGALVRLHGVFAMIKASM